MGAIAVLGDKIGTWTLPGSITSCVASNVFVNGVPIATKGDLTDQSNGWHYSDLHKDGHRHYSGLYIGTAEPPPGGIPYPNQVVPTSHTVFAHGRRVARLGDAIYCTNVYDGTSEQYHNILTAQSKISGQTVFAGD